MNKRHIYVTVAMAETAVGQAADEVGPDEPCAELRPIQRRECMGKGERGSARPLIFGIDVFSRHETRPVSRQDETIHPRELCYLHDFPIAFLALELSRPRIAGNLRFCIK